MVRSIYLAGRIRRRDELNRYRADLEAAGIEVTSSWLNMPVPDEWDANVWSELACIDREDVLRADALVLFAEPDRDGGSGRHVEFGMALALGKPIIVVGRIENLFQRLAEIRVVPDWPSALALLTQPTMLSG
ncbi:MAG TPA: nucleoside 2-deoxyribosyltransferase [Dehalococcoidia bacterium]|jgi:nucleoside 2-deoxyribosyltransferase|nr:nucleoside 2-deoxyribosyltransferase [Dehalococcoidia bacterium]